MGKCFLCLMLLRVVLAFLSECIKSYWNCQLLVVPIKVSLVLCNMSTMSIIPSCPSGDYFVQSKPTLMSSLRQLSSLSFSFLVLNRFLSTTSPTRFGKQLPTHFCKFIPSANMSWVGFFPVNVSNSTIP